MSTIYLALGSNIDPKKNIATAIKLLAEKIQNIRQAPLYNTKPFGPIAQAKFINTAIQGDTSLSPRELFVFVKEIEKKVGRQERERWGPREIDVDIALYDEFVLEDSDLHIPHVGLHQRDVVLQPLVDLDPTLIHPVLKTSLVELLKNIPAQDRFIIEKL